MCCGWRETSVLGATVWLAAGRYERRKTFELDQRDSGAGELPVSYKALPGAEVMIDGGKAVPVDACRKVASPAVLKRFPEEARERILGIELRKLGIADSGNLGPRGFRRAYIPAPLELFIDGKPQQIARWPNEGSMPMGKVVQMGSVPRNKDYGMKPGVITYEGDRPSRWTEAEDLYLSGIFNYGYADDTIPVAKLDAEKRHDHDRIAAPVRVREARVHQMVCAEPDRGDRPAGRVLRRPQERGALLLPARGSADSSIQVSVMDQTRWSRWRTLACPLREPDLRE